MSEPLKAGDRVRYCKAWIDTARGDPPDVVAIGAALTTVRGTVDDVFAGEVAVLWDDDDIPHACTPGMIRRADA